MSLERTLRDQALTAHTRRSARGEEMVARASVLMIAPLMLLMMTILILLIAPMVVSGRLFH